jgi:hypothetical protein
MKYFLLLLSSLSLQAEWKDWTEKEQDLFTDYIALNLIDIHMTNRNIQDIDTVVEANPLLGNKPSLEKLILHKAIITGTSYILLDKTPQRYREKDLKVMKGVLMVVVLHNGYVGFDIRKEF